MPSLTHRERIGTVIGGRYEIRRLIGEGGMGAVFEAQHRFTKRRVALKVLQAEYASNGEATARFLQEAQSATAINHTNIVQVLDMGVDGTDESQTVYLVLEFLEGEDLAARLTALHRLSPAETFDLLLPIMNALASAHAKGIVHRDLKPANVFLARQDDGAIVPKLLDFGISKVTVGEALARTSTGAILGTPYYMAPEQARGERNVDQQVDIWAMGVVLYQCLSGQLPFVADNYNQMIVKLITEEAPRLETVAPGIPAGVADVVHRALCKERAGRFASMEQFIGATLAFLKQNNTQQYRALSPLASIESDPTVASPTTDTGIRAPPPGIAVVPAPSTDLSWAGRAAQTTTETTAPRARWVPVAGVVVLLAAAGVAMTLAAGRHSGAPAASGAAAAAVPHVAPVAPAQTSSPPVAAPVPVAMQAPTTPPDAGVTAGTTVTPTPAAQAIAHAQPAHSTRSAPHPRARSTSTRTTTQSSGAAAHMMGWHER